MVEGKRLTAWQGIKLIDSVKDVKDVNDFPLLKFHASNSPVKKRESENIDNPDNPDIKRPTATPQADYAAALFSYHNIAVAVSISVNHRMTRAAMVGYQLLTSHFLNLKLSWIAVSNSRLSIISTASIILPSLLSYQLDELPNI